VQQAIRSSRSLANVAAAARVSGALVSAPVRVAGWFVGSCGRHWQNILAALVQVWANKARSLLTTLGIIIAVTSTITVVTLVQGFGNYMTDFLRGLGTNMMFVIPYNPGGMDGRMLGRVVMDIDDVRAVGARCDKVRRITPVLFGSVNIEYGHERAENVQLQGATEQIQTIRNYFTDEGRLYGPIDVDYGARVCVLGRDVLDLLQADDRIVGEDIFINQERFRVLGLLEHKGAVMGDKQGEFVLVPYTTALKMFPFMAWFMPFAVEATSEQGVEEASLQIAQVLRTQHRLEPGQPNDFRILRQDEFLRDFERVKLIATSALTGIVGISLIVGGVGIMNIMLVSVTERTREIGLRKSVGGRRRDILFQFLTEAVVLATLGGTIGVALGYTICGIASMHPSMVDAPVPIWVVALALGFSAAIGILFGMIPAFKAAILHPIDALRHE